MSMTVIYYCYGPQTVWISTVMSETVYADCRNIAIIREELAEDYNLNAGFFDSFYITRRESGVTDLIKEVGEIIDKEKPDVFAVFTWGGESNIKVYESLPDDLNVILIDEGTASYNYEKHFSIFSGEMDYSKIKEIWLIDPEFSLNSDEVPVYRIPVKELLDNKERFREYLNGLNSFFQYDACECAEVLFFDNYFVQGGFLSEELYNSFVENIMMLLGKSEIMIKSHPTESSHMFDRKYGRFEVGRFPYNRLPWELFVLNYLYKRYYESTLISFPKLLISVNTSALITSQILLDYFGYDLPIVFTYNLIDDWLPDKITITEDVINNYKKIYATRSIYIPKTWRGLAEVAKNYLDGVDIYSLEYIENREKQWLSDIKLNYGNCLVKSKRFDRITPIIELNDYFGRFCHEKGYKKVAIYGYGDVGKLLKTNLIAGGIEVFVAEKTSGFGVMSIGELKEVAGNLDLIIVTPILDFECIKDEIGSADKTIRYDEFVDRVRLHE